MKKLYSYIKAISLSFLFSGCNAIMQQPGSSSFSYFFNGTNCSTNEKTFSTLDAMCNALPNDALNNYCAEEQRYQKFQNECVGRTWH